MEYDKLAHELEQVRHGMRIPIAILLDQKLSPASLLAIRTELASYGTDLFPHFVQSDPAVVGLEVSDYQKAQELLERLHPNAPPGKRLEGIVLYETHHCELQVASRYGRPY